MAESRFDLSDKYALRVMGEEGQDSLLAFFNFVDTELGIQFKDFRLMDGKNGLFAQSASESWENADGETKYSNYVAPAYDFDTNTRDEEGAEYFQELTEAAYEEYERRKEEEGEKKSKKTAKGKGRGKDTKTASRGKKTSSRKSVGKGRSRKGRSEPPEVEQDEEESELPF